MSAINNLLKVAAKFEILVAQSEFETSKQPETIKSGSCEHPYGCQNSATKFCYGDPGETGHRSFMKLCDEHARYDSLNPGSEYQVDCPHCKLRFTVG